MDLFTEMSALTRENVEQLFSTIGELEISNRAKFSIGFVHLHQGYNAKSFLLLVLQDY